MSGPELIVMLTNNDFTVSNAAEIFESCKYSEAKFWGIKEKGLPLDQMKQLFSTFKQYGKTCVLEVVAYTEEECLKGAQTAAECGCDILLGTLFYDSVNTFCKENSIKYMPFVGNVSNRPSVLEGNIADMLAQAMQYLDNGVYGVDLLSYRYTGDSVDLNRQLIPKINAPVCIAGSINSYERLDLINDLSPAFFTIGGAFFEHRFGEDISEQINNVCRYMKQQSLTEK